jgi:hypothetical protein
VVRVQVTPKAARAPGRMPAKVAIPRVPFSDFDETRLTHLSWTTPRFCVMCNLLFLLVAVPA